MVYLYYPSKFEKIIERAISELDNEKYKKNPLQKDDLLLSYDPEYDEDCCLVRRECYLRHYEEDKEKPSRIDEFGSYWRHISDNNVYIVREKGEEKQKLHPVLISELINNPRFIDNEQFEIRNEKTGDSFVDFFIENNNRDFVFRIYDVNPAFKLIPARLHEQSHNTYNFKKNEKYVKDVIKEITEIVFDYRTKTKDKKLKC
ncbi:MAG: hypothetical protein WC863_04915 [Patescibacteria group bacterium]